jgi:flagellin-like hook-associated protein FlgL
MQNVAARLDKSIEKLASGEMINRAGDDASGLAVQKR